MEEKIQSASSGWPVSERTCTSCTLWSLISATSGLGDELDRARLMVTGLPALLRCRLSAVALLDETQARWNLVLQKDGQLLAPPPTESALADLPPLFEEVARKQITLIATDDSQAHDGRPPSFVAALGIRRLAVAPLLTHRSRLGMLFVGRDPDDAFSSADEFAIQTLADNLAIGIEHLRRNQALKQESQGLRDLIRERTEKLRQAKERHRVLLGVNNAIMSNLDRESLFSAISQTLRRALPFDRSSLTLHEPTRDVLQVYAMAGVSAPNQFLPVGSEFPRRGSHLESVFEYKRPLICRDLAKKDRVGAEDSLLKEGIRSYIAVPLVVKEDPVGSLNVGSLTPDQYSEADVDFLMEVGQQVALAVKNMLNYEQIAELKNQLEQENIYLQEEIKTQHNFEEIIGESPLIKQVLDAVETVARTDANVLISGETGTGKELIARAVHNLSKRKDKPLIKVNCASIPRELFESEFFGHVKGAFTGALQDRLGRFQLADGGTLFLDEVAEIPLELQGKLLRVLQGGEFERIGEEFTRKVDVRIITATNRDLRKEIEADRFRQDLYFRLSVFPIEVPPLRTRVEDIPVLAAYYLKQVCRRLGMPEIELRQRHVHELQSYRWPGNVRELQNIIERAVITARSGKLNFDLPAADKPGQATDTEDPERPQVGSRRARAILTQQELKRQERESILAALERANWKVSGPGGAAELLGMKAPTLSSRIKAMGLKRTS